MQTETEKSLAEEYLDVLKDLPWIEGCKDRMYLDNPVRGARNITIGRGHLLPLSEAVKLPFMKGGESVDKSIIQKTYEEIASELEPTHKLSLSSSSIDSLAVRDINKKIEDLRKHFPNFDEFPRKAQMGVLDVWYNTGGGGFPKFRKAVEKGDWSEAAFQSHRAASDKVKGVYVRNTLAVVWFCQAVENKSTATSCRRFRQDIVSEGWHSSEGMCEEPFCPISAGRGEEKEKSFCYNFKLKVQAEGWPNYEERYFNGGFCPLGVEQENGSFIKKFKQKMQEQGWATYEELLTNGSLSIYKYQKSLTPKQNAEFIAKLKELDKLF